MEFCALFKLFGVLCLLADISQNAGQNCIGIERLIVHSLQHDTLLALLAERVRKLRLGSVLHSADGFISPVDCGAMISSDRFDDLERVIAEAVESGAQLEVGGSRWTHSYLEGGAYFSPTVIGNVHQGMDIAQRECEYTQISVYSSLTSP